MYCGVPTSAPVAVSDAEARGSGAGAGPSPASASPKSTTRTRPSGPTIALLGLKSRWTTPAACAWARPRAACRYISSTSRQPRGAWARQRASVGPATNSIATNTSPPSSPTS